MSSSPNNAREIFVAAVKLAPDRWDAYLKEACGGDEALRDRVHNLLVAHQEAGSFLEPAVAALAVTNDELVSERPGTAIGPYKLLQQIGEGGMGTVFMAEQTQPVHRKVALKVIKPGMDSRQVIARFEAERQALAMMDHVNIARVLDAGATDTGRPYFVMELVHGVPITKYCDDNHLTPRERLELFVSVCQAIQHAHQKGIIHRDIKPSNVMITLYDGKPVPKVIDFGVAKATEQKLTERTLFTQYGTMVGTLEYMSPEQAEMSALGIDTRSDIFSLGVLLYELLAGSTPLDRKRMKEAAHAEIVRMIKEVEPPRPSRRLSESGEALASISAQRHMEPAKLSKLVRGELDWIVMKALEKDRNRRYETANGFAADVLRYLVGEAVQAVPPSSAYRFHKFARRNNRALAIAAVLGLAILTVAGTLGWAIRDRESQAQEAARDRVAREMTLELEVNRALKEAEQWQEQEKWMEALSAVKRGEGLLAGGGSDGLRERVRQVRTDLDMVLRLEEIRFISFDMQEHRFDWETVDRAYAQAFAEYGIDVPGLPVEEAAARIRVHPGVLVALVAALDDWADLRHGRDPAGRLKLTAVAQAADRDSWRWQVRQAVQKTNFKTLGALAVSPDLLRQPPASVLALANAFRIYGRKEAQIAVLRQAQWQYPGDLAINFELGIALSLLGPPSFEEAVSFLRAAVAVRPSSSGSHHRLGRVFYTQKKSGEALACYRKAVELDPNDALAHGSLGGLLIEQGKLDEGIASFRKAVESGPKHPWLIFHLGQALMAKGKMDEAIACFDKATELRPDLSLPYAARGTVYRRLGQTEKAIAHYSKAIEMEPGYYPAWYSRGTAHLALKQYDKALVDLSKAIQLKPDYPSNHCAWRRRAHIYEILRQNDRAVADYSEILRLNPDDAGALSSRASAYTRLKQWDKAFADWTRVLELQPKNPGPSNSLAWFLATCLDPKFRDAARAVELAKAAVVLAPKDGHNWNTLGVAQYRARDCKAALTALHKSMELREGGDSYDWFFLAMAHWDQGNQDEARKWYDRAAQWTAKNDPTNDELRRFRAEAHDRLGVRDHILFEGSGDQVRSVAYFPNGRRALSAGFDKFLRVWDLATGKQLSCWEGHTSLVWSVALSPDGSRALSGSSDGTVRLWDVAAGKELLRFEHGARVSTVAFSPDGRRALSGGHDKTIRLWDVATGKELLKLEGHTDAVRSVAFSPDGLHILSGSHDRTVRLRDVTTGKEIRSFEGHTDLVLTVAFSPDGRRALSGGCDQTVRLWDVETGKPLASFAGHRANIESLVFTSDSLRAVSGCADGTIRLWDLNKGQEVYCIGTTSVLGVALSPDGRQVLSANTDNSVRLWTLPRDGKGMPEAGKDDKR